MFSRKQESPIAAAKPGKSAGLSFIGPEVVIGGDVMTSTQLHIDGRIDGHVRCAQLCQGGTGVVSGDIVADEARLAGLVEGTVNAGTLVIEASARIRGDVTYETISIAAGARIDGRLARREALTADAATRREPPPLKSAGEPVEMFPTPEPRLAAG